MGVGVIGEVKNAFGEGEIDFTRSPAEILGAHRARPARRDED
jgi:hypothetical protein